MTLSVILCSWRNPDALDACIRSLISSSSVQTEIKVALNEPDQKSINLLEKKNIQYYVSPHNLGHSIVDLCTTSTIGKYVCNVNDDMLFHYGWDMDLINLCEKYYPASASSTLISPRDDSHLNIIHDLGYITDPSTEIRLRQNVSLNYYNRNNLCHYSHPILVKRDDYIKVNGYANKLQEGWFPGWGLDDFFAFRLWKLHNEKFKFILSGSSFAYHHGSLTIDKLSIEDRYKNNGGHDKFLSETGLTINQFKNIIEFGKII